MKLISIHTYVNSDKETFYTHQSDIETHHDIVKMRKLAAAYANYNLADTFEIFDKEDNSRTFVFTFYVNKNYISVYVDITDVKTPCNVAA